MRCAISGNRNLLWILLWKLSPNFVVSSTLNTALVSCVWAVGRLVRWGWGYKRPGCTVWGWLDTLASSGSAVVVRPQYSREPPPRHAVDTLCPSSQHHAATAHLHTWHVTTRGHTRPHLPVVNTCCYCRDLWQGLGLGNELNNACIRNTFKSFKWAVIFNCLY